MRGQTPIDVMLQAYREGIFPMAENAGDGNFAFYRPFQRGIIPIETLHIPAKLLKTLRKHNFTARINQNFETIIDGCAAATPKRSKTWINKPIRDLFVMLHKNNHAHSVEIHDQSGKLCGGLYGLAIGGVFCGESMVSFEKDASKIALIYLCALLWKGGFETLDTQFINPHLLQFGAYEIPQEEYETHIKTTMNKKTDIVKTSALGMGNILNAYLEFRKL